MSNRTDSRPGSRAEDSERYVSVARLAILWERLWRASWPATGILGLFVAAALFGAFEFLPQALHRDILFLVVFATGAFLHRNLKAFRLPRWEDGARRVERDSRLVHRPITESQDRLAVGAGDAAAEELWRAHLRRLLARIENLRVRLPSPGLQARDPHAARFAVLLLLLAGAAVAGHDAPKRLALAFTPDSGTNSSTASLDAWINPPAYTGQAPVYLQHPVDADTPVAVPAGSQLVLRVHAAHGLPNLALEPEPGDAPARFNGASGEYGVDVALVNDGAVRVISDGKLLARFQVHAIADHPPTIAFAGAPSKTERDALKIAFTAADDYGVVSARAIIRPKTPGANGALSVDLPLAASTARTLQQTVYRDLTGEPLAGLDVDMVLEAKDGAGQTGYSKHLTVHLPARVFTSPLARALIEQRQNLAIGAPHARDNAVLALDALSLAPERFYQQENTAYLGVRTAFWSLKNAHSAADVADVEQLLWAIAVSLEQGGLLSAAEQLRALQQMISQALAQGAPQDVIDALLDRYRQALQRYLQALAQNAPQGNSQMASGAKSMNQDDLDAMLKAIQQMAQTGSREAAAQAMAMLQNLIENLRVTAGAGKGSGDKALSDAIAGLGDLIGRQRQLLDKTYRQGQGAGDPKDGGGKGLAGEQGKIKGDLDKLLKGLNTPKGRQQLGDAGRDMGSSQNSLGSNDFDSAGQAQKDALDALRATADALAKQMMQESGQNAQQQDEGNSDPLGRKEGTTGFSSGDGTKIPDRDSLARARSILEELRRRAAERGRPKQELDYYDRLLKEF